MTRIGYLRIRPAAPDPGERADALAAANCTRVYVDTATGALADRPQLDEALAQLRAGDVLVVPQLVDPARSLAHLVGLVADLTARGAALVSLAEGLDTARADQSTALAALATLDPALASERTERGRRAPRAKGAATGGRPRTVTPEKLDQAKTLMATGQHTMAEIAETVGIARSTLYRHLSPDHRP